MSTDCEHVEVLSSGWTQRAGSYQVGGEKECGRWSYSATDVMGDESEMAHSVKEL